MPYIACRPLNVGESVRQVNEPVPEAEDWPHLQAYINHGHIRWVDRLPEQPKPVVPTPTARRAGLPKPAPTARRGARQRKPSARAARPLEAPSEL